MQIIGYVVYAVGLFLAVTWLVGIRTYTAKGLGVTKQTVNTTMLFILALLLVPAFSLSALHLLWMFLAGWIVGTLSLVFPFSLLSILGQVVFHIACIGLDPVEIQRRQEVADPDV